MYNKIAAACSASLLAIAGALVQAPAAFAVGAAIYCFEFPNKELYLGKPVYVELYDANAGWVAVHADTTSIHTGCYSHIFDPEHREYYSRATAYAVDDAGRVWTGSTGYDPPGDQTVAAVGVVTCYGPPECV